MTAESIVKKDYQMKGIVLAGGSGSRLNPVTQGISKQLLPIYDKPMIYYPISTLMLADIREILLISTPHDLPSYKRLLGDGRHFGCEISYATQCQPRGIVDAFLIGEPYIKGDSVALVLGDNLFHGGGFSGILERAAATKSGGCIFGIRVNNPSQYGVAKFGHDGRISSVEEKPKNPASDIAIVGLYFFDNLVVDFAKNVPLSNRKELEITEIINTYLKNDALHLEILPRGLTWLDTGTHESMMRASQYVYAVEERSGVKIACLEEIAMQKGWITPAEVSVAAVAMGAGTYSNYLKRISDEHQ